MKLSTVFLSGLLVGSLCSTSEANHGVYYAELKALKDASETKLLFQQDVDGGSRTTQCNLLKYGQVPFAKFNDWRRALSLGNIKRQIMIGKKLSFIDSLVNYGIFGYNDDLIIVTHETMPALYDYVCSLSKENNIVTPFVFVTLREGFFSTLSQKIFAFRGSIVIGQQLLHDISDTELEALVAQEIGHIKYNHLNKKMAICVGCAGLTGLAWGTVLAMTGEKDISAINNNHLLGCVMVSYFLSSLFDKYFEKRADVFASEVAGKADGLIEFYERLQERDQVRVAEFDELSTMLSDNAFDISPLLYIRLLAFYGLAKAEHCVTKVYNKFMYPTHQERIDAAKEYLAQQEA